LNLDTQNFNLLRQSGSKKQNRPESK